MKLVYAEKFQHSETKCFIKSPLNHTFLRGRNSVLANVYIPPRAQDAVLNEQILD